MGSRHDADPGARMLHPDLFDAPIDEGMFTDYRTANHKL